MANIYTSKIASTDTEYTTFVNWNLNDLECRMDCTEKERKKERDRQRPKQLEIQ